jgi:YVTN family beta-propeller protein
MFRSGTVLLVFFFSPFFLCAPSVPPCLCGLSADTNRSPIDIALLPGGRVLTANHTADSVSLVDLENGKVLADVSCGRKPSAISCSRDGTRAVVCNLWSGTVTLIGVRRSSLDPLGGIAVGPLPRGSAFSPDGDTVYVTVANEVVQCDWKTKKIVRRLPAPREPQDARLSPDGRWLVVAGSRSGIVTCWETQSGNLHWQRKIEDAFNLRGLPFTPDGKAVVCAHAVRREFPVSKENIEQGWVIDSRLTRLPLDPKAQPPLEQVALDTRGKAVGDPHGVAFTADGRRLAVAAAGTHELLLLDVDHVPWTGGDPGDLIDPALRDGEHAMRRVPLGGRPTTVVLLEGARLAVSNYLLDAVQVVDADAGRVVRTVPLGSPGKPSPARQGEALFYDATRSHNQWFSCHTCHAAGHTCGLTFDTLNDDSYGNPKLTPTLRNVTKTGPWTWHGWQKDLAAGVKKSITETMFGPPPTGEEVKAIVAFLGTLDHPPNPTEATEATKRGEALFRGKANCIRCHKGEQYTSEGVYDVGLESDGSPYRLWNPPSLRGLWDRGPYLHDGRAKSLDELLQTHHQPEKLGGKALTEREQRELVAFLRSL